ncbi:hypothetical protein [Halalkalicoccus tibetensis]|uniref:Uncharacterized protein n=1 Tax=Halalkalicoccus tibetensis TaxID=175632 RepID=A0ABD5V4E4_9EURY
MWEIYYSSYALHVMVVCIVLVLILPRDSEVAVAIAIGLEGVATLLFVQRMPHLAADIEIPRWYTLIADCYIGIITFYLISDLESYYEFTFYIWPIAAIPLTILSTLVLVLNDDFDLKDDWPPE